MKFEEALSQMRLGKKITNPSLGEDVYLQACTVGTIFNDSDPMNAPVSIISIVKMKGEFQHPDMLGGSLLKKPCNHGNLPQINLLLLMASDWEIIEEK